MRVSQFYEVVGIDLLMHTMSDSIGDTDKFDKMSRMEIFQKDYIIDKTVKQKLREQERLEEERKRENEFYDDL